MSRDSAINELLSINLRLESEISRLRDGCLLTDVSRLRIDLRSGRQCIMALQQGQDFALEVAMYRRSLQELLALLPHLRTRLLIERVRVEEASQKLNGIREWARSASRAK
jgi:hypothetical protein